MRGEQLKALIWAVGAGGAGAWCPPLSENLQCILLHLVRKFLQFIRIMNEIDLI